VSVCKCVWVWVCAESGGLVWLLLSVH